MSPVASAAWSSSSFSLRISKPPIRPPTKQAMNPLPPKDWAAAKQVKAAAGTESCIQIFPNHPRARVVFMTRAPKTVQRMPTPAPMPISLANS